MTKVTVVLIVAAFLLMSVSVALAEIDKYKWATDNDPGQRVQKPRSGTVTDDIGNVAYDWIEINPAQPGGLPGTDTGLHQDDGNAGPFALGFSMPFYDGIFDAVRVCSNGWASFTSTSTAYSNQQIPNTGEPNNLAAPYWDDLNTGTFGTILFYADPGNEFFVVEWDSVPHLGSYAGNYFTFEAIFYPDGTIDYMYKAIEQGAMSSFPSATVGVENDDGTEGEQATYNGSGPYEPATGIGIRYTPPSPNRPNVCTNFTATPDPGGALSCDLTWDLPTITVGGDPISSYPLTAVYLERDGVPFPPLPPMMTSYTDASMPTNGVYVYTVYAVNAEGTGLTTDVTVYVGPPEYEEITYNWVEINPNQPGYDYVGTNSGIVNDDHNVGPFDIGFVFPWYDMTFPSSIRLCSNGWASFTSTSGSYLNYELPSTSAPADLVAPYWDDMNPSPSSSGYGTVWYYSDPGGEFFVAEWDSMNHFGSSYVDDYFTFELILYPDGNIDYMYKDIVPGTVTPFPSATVGIQNGAQNTAVQTTFDGSGPWEPTSGSGVRIFSVGGEIPDVAVTLTPYGTPIQLPASGGMFDFNIAVSNNETSPQALDIWTDVTLPNSSMYGPIININVNVPASFTGDRDRDQMVPAGAPTGMYSYNAYVGVYPDMVYGSDSFPFEKLAAGDGMVVNEWTNSGESFAEWMTETPVVTPADFAVQAVYPNPFNPTTTLSYTLAANQKVSLAVYDISGRQVAQLVDGYRSAGLHQVTFDASGLASGVYIYQLIAGEQLATGKLMLLK